MGRTGMTYVIGLTGNICTGKSTVSKILQELGVHIIDADVVTRKVMMRGQRAYNEIVEAFGQEMLGPNGEIDRARLGRRVFGDTEALRRLEELVHPATIEWITRDIENSDADVIVIEAIKLIESGMVIQLCDVLWVVDAPPEIQLSRLMKSRGMSREDALQRIHAQPPQAEKVASADVVIDNSGSIEETRQQVMAAWGKIPKGDAESCGGAIA